eukprot:6203743-Pleurochrysis_carterae.AAC.1
MSGRLCFSGALCNKVAMLVKSLRVQRGCELSIADDLVKFDAMNGVSDADTHGAFFRRWRRVRQKGHPRRHGHHHVFRARRSASGARGEDRDAQRGDVPARCRSRARARLNNSGNAGRGDVPLRFVLREYVGRSEAGNYHSRGMGRSFH